MSTENFENEIQQDFLEEAKELLSQAEICFLNLEKCGDDPSVLEQIFRLAHNLKGSSRAVGFADLADFTHHLESLLLALKNKEIPRSEKIVTLLLQCNDYLTATIGALQLDLKAGYKNEALSRALVAALEAKDIAAEQASSEISITIVPKESDDAQGFVIQAPAPSSAKSKDDSIRVNLGKIDQLLNNIGELVILQSVMHQQGLSGSEPLPPPMRKTLSAMAKIVKETQEISMGLRMLPIRQTFQKMQRIVRDTSKALGKQVELNLSGEETEVDKTVLEQIGDPLVHIIRNAVDHGLEDVEGREKVGKSAMGRVSLSAFHKAGQVVIEIRDDGKGLDAEKLIEIAKRKKVIADDAVLTKDQAHQLIFAPGFSTKAEVTDLSGRGVGMDVVKTNITQLQGSIEIETELGVGTCFRISIPLTLGIIDGIVVRLGDERYVVPLSQVAEFFRPKENEINFVHERDELLKVREETLPVLRLSHLLRKGAKRNSDAWSLTALITRDARHRGIAVMVDEVLAQQQIVIKPLGGELKARSGLMGSAILGDGRPALIIDLHEMAKLGSAVDTSHLRTKRTQGMEAL